MNTVQDRASDDILAYAERTEYGARANDGIEGRLIGAIALAWAAFQLWFASPLPYIFDFAIFNDGQARMIHLGFALFLAFAISPFRAVSALRIPFYDWMLSAAGAFTCLYGLLNYQALAARAGQPILLDLAVAGAGILLVLEATRRTMGPFLVAVALAFLGYSYFGPYMPEVLQHRGASLTRILEHQWLSSQGVFGVPLGASAAFVFIYVLFGTLFNKAGAGHYIMQLTLAFLGHFRGGPAKVAVVSSGLNGLISGSALANVVSTGIFTIPLMKKSGLSGIKAGAIETSASINGQIMPPVMGAAAFIMVEYVGIPYAEVVRHAFLPAIISYISLLYIVHLESLKAGIAPVHREKTFPMKIALLRYGIGISATLVALGGIYYILKLLEIAGGEQSGLLIALFLAALYIASIVLAARHPDLEPEDPSRPITSLPNGWDVARSGLHLLVPVFVLIWTLMILRLSPGLAAFWATLSTLFIMMTQEPLKRLIRRQDGAAAALMEGFGNIVEGLILGARNMVGVALATATAGIIVGTVTLTGLGLMMTDAVGALSGGNIYLVLLLTALVTLILGCGVPTTANYVLVATLMAPVVVELGSEAGVAIPLIAVHLFVFYFGIMADATPPVGLGAYAAAAISGESPLMTAMQAAQYSFRTAILAFVMIFNPEILLIGIESVPHLLLVVVASIVGVLMFAAATLRFWMIANKFWETLALFVVAATLVYPTLWLDLAYPKYKELPPSELVEVVESVPEDGRLVVRFEGMTIEGDPVSRTASLRLGPADSAENRLAYSGLRLSFGARGIRISQVQFGSYAARIKLEPGFELAAINVPADRPNTLIIYLLGFLLLAFVALSQWLRRRRSDKLQQHSLQIDP